MATKKPTRPEDAPNETEPNTPAPAPAPDAASEDAPQGAAFDDDLLYAEDENGNRVSDEEVNAALKPETLRFEFAKQTHKIEVSALGVSLPLVGRLTLIGTQLALEAGYKRGDQISEGANGEAPDERFARLVSLTEQSSELRDVYSEIAAVATVRDEAGRARTSVAPLREELSAQKLRDLGALGEAYTGTVQGWWQRTQ